MEFAYHAHQSQQFLVHKHDHYCGMLSIHIDQIDMVYICERVSQPRNRRSTQPLKHYETQTPFFYNVINGDPKNNNP